MQEFKQFELKLDLKYEYGLSVEDRKYLLKLVDKLNKCYKNDMQNFAETCYIVKRIKDLFDSYFANKYVTDLHKHDLRFDDIMKGFGFEQSQSSRIISCFDKYIDVIEDKAQIKDVFLPFSKSKLFELIPVETAQLVSDINNKVLNPYMSVQSIREYVKNYKAMQKANSKISDKKEDETDKIKEEDIPMAYDPKKYYKFDYFENKTKSQLLNMIWDLQKEYQRLKGEIKK